MSNQKILAALLQGDRIRIRTIRATIMILLGINMMPSSAQFFESPYVSPEMTASNITLPVHSPEVASLFKFEKNKIDMYRGTAIVSIPIYNIQLSDLTIPISLHHQATGLKPNQQIGRLGANWNLSGGGTIRLNRIGDYDRYRQFKPIDESIYIPMVEFFGQTYFNSHFGGQDISRDSYSFNFNGHSGNIFVDNHNNIHCSDPELKVEFGTSAFVGEALGEDMGLIFGSHNCIIKITTSDGTEYFFGGDYCDKMDIHGDQGEKFQVRIAWHLFKIITPRGHHVNYDYDLKVSSNASYIFGQTIFDLNNSNVPSGIIDLDEWTLTQDNGALFDVYHKNNTNPGDYALCIDKTWYSQPGGTNISANDHKLFIIPTDFTFENESIPIESKLQYYSLKRIQTSNEIIDFKENGDNFFYELWSAHLSEYPFYDSSPGEIETLDEIVIYQKSKNDSEIYKRFELEYNNYTITSVQEYDKNGISLNPYELEYSDTGKEGFVLQITNEIDHWGFYNATHEKGSDFAGLLPVTSSDYLSREPIGIVLENDPITRDSYLLAGTLTRITYPTKGFTEFEYESHEFGSKVSRDNNAGVSNLVFPVGDGKTSAGGIRIKKITDVPNPDDLTASSTREFKYLKNYLKPSLTTGENKYSVNIEEESSGIINSSYSYYMRIDNSYDLKSDFIGDAGSLPVHNHIGYSEVIEIENEDHITVHTYTDQESNPDKNPYQTAHFTVVKDAFHQEGMYGQLDMDNVVLAKQSQVSLELERGKPLYTRQYMKNDDASYSIVKEIEFIYRDDAERFNNKIEYLESNVTITNSSKLYLPGYINYPSATETIEISWGDRYTYDEYKYPMFMYNENTNDNVPIYQRNNIVALSQLTHYFYDYTLTEEITRQFDKANNTKYIESSTYYQYTDYSQISQQYVSNSFGGISYLFDYYDHNGFSNTAGSNMFANHMVGIPYEKTVSGNGGIIEQQYTEYDDEQLGLPTHLTQFRSLDGANGNQETTILFDEYSSKGNLLQYHEESGIPVSFIWNNGFMAGGGDPYSLVDWGFDSYENLYAGIFGNNCAMIQRPYEKEYLKLWKQFQIQEEEEKDYWNIFGKIVANLFTGGIPHFFDLLTDEDEEEFFYCNGSAFEENTFVLGSFAKLTEDNVDAVLSMDIRYDSPDHPTGFKVYVGYSDISLVDIVDCPNCVLQNGTVDKPYLIQSAEYIEVVCNSSDYGDWKNYSCNIEIPANKYMFFCIEFDVDNGNSLGWNNLYLDNLKLERCELPVQKNNNDGNRIIAMANNATVDEIFATSFENDPYLHTWNGTFEFDDTRSKTGNLSLRTGDTDTEEDFYYTEIKYPEINEDTKFNYSAWFYSTGPSADVYLFWNDNIEENHEYLGYDRKNSSSIGKWVFLEGETTVPAGTKKLFMRVDNNGQNDVFFDDLRFYPSDAQMTTYTYDPLIGMTSQTDSNGIITYYEYDDFGRLIRIKDSDGNVVQETEYNYATQ